MTRIRTTNELILSLLSYFRTVQPNLDTKPGTTARDIIIDGPSAQVSRLYEELNSISNKNSIRQAIGADLDRLGQNYRTIRRRGAKSTGPALLAFDSLLADIPINKGDIIEAKNGSSFVVLNSLVISTTQITRYQATAAKYRADLDFVGITDRYAAEVLVEASAPGEQGNISKYSLVSTSISDINNVTNVTGFGGGRNSEDDADFRNRIFAIFGGANTGTELGYRNASLGDPSVISVEVIEPGDTLMVRDGTEVFINEDGSRVIISEGTGGKVDIYVFGTRIQEVVDSYIYRDTSNTGDPTHPDNNIVLGQISNDINKTVSRRRLENLAAGVLPNQPVNSIVSVSGSLSGGSFLEKQVDNLGRVTGNYELKKDVGAFAGSPWGNDALSWISDRISSLPEDKTKLSFNGQDPLSFTDVTEIPKISQNISVINENSKVSASNRSSVQLAHSPVQNVTRVSNITTGEKYIISNQNPDGGENLNETGRITITGQSLPAVSDTLQVDYTWVHNYDPTLDFDNHISATNPRTVQDSIDWGFSNAVRRERVTLMTSGSSLSATVTHPISTVISVNAFAEDTGDLTLSSGRLAFITSAEISNVVSIVRDNDGSELWNTSSNDGAISSQTIFLPSDTVGSFGESVTVIYNAEDVYNTDSSGNFNSNNITVVPSSVATSGRLVEVNYIANVSTILPATTLAALPAIRNGNAFDTNAATSIGTQPTTHIFADSVINKNLRRAPTNLGLSIAGSISPGTFTVTGTTLEYAANIVYTVGTAGLTQQLSNAIKSYLNLNSQTSIPSNITLARINKVERVTTSGSEVLEVLQEYDLRGYGLQNNSFFLEESIVDSSLSSSQFTLPSTPSNVANPPSVGDRIRVSFHLMTTNNSENVPFSRSGLLYTDKKFAIINTIAISSGFSSGSSSSATLTVSSLNQPATRSRYRAYYDYLAPKPNERITIRHNYDRIITDVTLAIEDTRPINADVLVKSAVSINVDVTMNIVVTPSFTNNGEIVKQNVQDVVTAALNAQDLGTIIDSSDLVTVAYTVDGVDRVRIIFFNETGNTGSVLSISAEKNEYISANNVIVNIETR